MRYQAEVERQTEEGAAMDLRSLFEEHHRAVFYAAYRLTGSVVDSEDVLQTVFLRMASRDDLSLPLASSAAYLKRAAVNAAVDILRRRKAAPDSLHLVPEPFSGNGKAERDLLADRQALRDWLRSAVGRMSQRMAEVFALRFLEGYGNSEIAGILNTSENTIAVTVHRLRAQLKMELDETLGAGNENRRKEQ